MVCLEMMIDKIVTNHNEFNAVKALHKLWGFFTLGTLFAASQALIH